MKKMMFIAATLLTMVVGANAVQAKSPQKPGQQFESPRYHSNQMICENAHGHRIPGFFTMDQAHYIQLGGGGCWTQVPDVRPGPGRDLIYDDPRDFGITRANSKRAIKAAKRVLGVRKARFMGVTRVSYGGVKNIRYTMHFRKRGNEFAVRVKQNHWSGRIKKIFRVH